MAEIIECDGIMVPIGSHEGKTVVIGSDHRGFNHKTEIVKALKEKGIRIIDVGTDSSERCDYPIISGILAQKVAEGMEHSRIGIGICGSGIGMSIPASKQQGIYAARCLTPEEAETSRKHNNTNFLGIGADHIDLQTALLVIDAWLKTPFYSDPDTEKPYLRRYLQTVEFDRLRRKQ